jgi:hypothetical protein
MRHGRQRWTGTEGKQVYGRVAVFRLRVGDRARMTYEAPMLIANFQRSEFR